MVELLDTSSGAAGSGGAGGIGRRSVLRGALLGSTGLAAAALFGCATTATAPPVAAPAAGQAASGKQKLLNEDFLAFNDPKMPFPYIRPHPDLPPKSGGTWKHSTFYEPTGFDPTDGTNYGPHIVVDTVSESLMDIAHGARGHPTRYDLEPGVAKSWEISPDGLTYTWKLNGNIKFHNKPPVNGRAFTAEDVRAVYDRYAKVGASRDAFENVDSFRAVDPTTFQIKLKAPQTDFLAPLGTRQLTLYAIEQASNGDFKNMRDAAGIGAYILKDFQKSQLTSFVRNPDYWRGRPGYLDGIELKVTPEASSRLAAWRVGQVDFAITIATTLDDTIGVAKTRPDAQVTISPPTNSGAGVALNVANPKFADERVRQALSLAFDRQKYVDVVAKGNGAPQLGFHIPWYYVYDAMPTTGAAYGPWMRFDAAEAKKLFAAAGVEKLAFDVIRYAPYMGEGPVGFYIDQLKAQGITANFKTMDYTAFSSTWQVNKLEEGATGSVTGSNIVADIYFKNFMKTGASGNRWRISDPEIDRWADEQSVELDPAKRRATLKKIWDKVGQKAYFPLENPAVLGAGTFYNPYIMNFTYGGARGAIQSDASPYWRDVWFNK